MLYRWSNTMASTSANIFPFLDLPAELRIHIYKYSTHPWYPDILSEGPAQPLHYYASHSALTQACRQLRAETLKLFQDAVTATERARACSLAKQRHPINMSVLFRDVESRPSAFTGAIEGAELIPLDSPSGSGGTAGAFSALLESHCGDSRLEPKQKPRGVLGSPELADKAMKVVWSIKRSSTMCFLDAEELVLPRAALSKSELLLIVHYGTMRLRRSVGDSVTECFVFSRLKGGDVRIAASLFDILVWRWKMFIATSKDKFSALDTILQRVK